MSNRRNAFKDGVKNPAKYFLSWKSANKAFSFYDKDKKENVLRPLPFKFLTLFECSTIKGWNDKEGGSIFSNEVKSMSQELNVRVFSKDGKVKEIAKGIYKEIKDKIVAAGGRYHKSIYVMTEKGDILNLQLKGASVQQWGEFTQKTRSRLADEWVTVTDVIEGQKGSVTYFTPKFEFTGSLNPDDASVADSAFDTLEAYLNTYFSNDGVDEEASDDFPTASDEPAFAVGDEINNSDDLPF